LPARTPAFGELRARLAALAAAAMLAALAGCTTAPRWETDLGMGDLVASTTADATAYSAADELARFDPARPRPPYRIGIQDELTITVWGPKELWSDISAQGEQATQTTVVHDNGAIVLPLLRPVQVEGLTVPEALARIVEAYKTTVGATVQAEGRVSRFRSRSILLDGAFNKPGIVSLSGDLATLGEAISGVGGGLPESADAARGILFRGGKRYRIDYPKAQEGRNDLLEVALQSGDRIFFPSRSAGVYYVLGEVVLQGSYPIPPNGVTLAQALTAARGTIMPTADMQAIYLVRTNDTESKIYQVTLEQIIAGQDIAIRPGDRLFVPPTMLTNWDRTWRQILPFFSGALVYYGTILSP